MEVNCYGTRIALTQATRKYFYSLKKTHLQIAKTENHIKFLKRCKKCHIIPKGLLVRIPFKSRRSEKLKQEFGRMLVQEVLRVQKGKLAHLRKEEQFLRCYVFSHTDLQQWEVLWNYIEVVEEKEFQITRDRQLRKFENLLQHQHRPRIGSTTRGDKTVVNMSKRQLDIQEFQLLSKGLQFVPFCTTVNKMDIAASVELTLHKNKGADKNTIVSTITDNRLWGKDSFGQDNLTTLEKRALSSLRRDESICILNADKGKAVVVMDREDYESKLESIIFSDTYEKLRCDPSRTLDNKIRKIVRNLKKLDNTPRNIAFRLIGDNFRDPAMYGAPKIHKPDVPLRPIVSTFGSVFAKCSRFVATVLQFYLQDTVSSSSVLNSAALVREVKSLNLPKKFIMVSFDVNNLFGSLDQNQCRCIILDVVRDDQGFETRFEIPKRYFIMLLDICLQSSYFKYKDDFFKQLKGVPMGSSCSPAIAEMYMRSLERKISLLPRYDLMALWKRYIDDILAFWKGTRRQLTIFLSELNKLDPNVKFTMELEEESSLPFLDVRLTKCSNGLQFSMYSKPTDSGLLLNYRSYHPPETKSNLIIGEAIRCLRISDNSKDDLDKLRAKLVSNSYPDKLVNNTLDRVSVPKDDSLQLSDRGGVLSLPYMGKLSRRLKKVVKKDNITLVNKKAVSLGAIFSGSYKYKTDKDTNIVYKIPCSCGDFYVGETCKSLDRRISQHQYDVLNSNTNNGIAVHVLSTGHRIRWKDASVLDHEHDYKLRKIKEALYISKLNPSLNLYDGFSLQGSWNKFIPD